MDFLQFLFSLKRSQKRLVSVSIDSVFLLFAFWFALFVRLDSVAVLFKSVYWGLIALTVPISIAAFVRLGLYRAVLRYIGSQAFITIVAGVGISTIALVLLAYYGGVDLPRTVPFIYAAFALVFVGGARALMRSLVGAGINRRGEPVIIYGAGVSGRQTAIALAQSHEYHPVAFVDDDESLHNTSMQGLHVYSSHHLSKLIKQRPTTRVLLAMPSASRSRRQEIINQLEPLTVKVMTLPAMADLVDRKSVV